MTQTHQFHVPDMTCGHCKASVEKALSGVAGVHSVVVDLATKQVQVQADDNVKADALLAQLDDVGFTGQPA
jgi:copper chaperone